MNVRPRYDSSSKCSLARLTPTSSSNNSQPIVRTTIGLCEARTSSTVTPSSFVQASCHVTMTSGRTGFTLLPRRSDSAWNQDAASRRTPRKSSSPRPREPHPGDSRERTAYSHGRDPDALVLALADLFDHDPRNDRQHRIDRRRHQILLMREGADVERVDEVVRKLHREEQQEQPH